MDSYSRNGTSGPPPPPFNGNIPARRLPTQVYNEAPACVQNAMMTKDKKPFTYTPGGIDLSQIKSPRMAKRISRNANMEGANYQQAISPLAQNSTGNISHQSFTPGITSGMPVQVFPNPPPAPPPPPKIYANSNSLSDKKQSTQPFEPPPLGCRPEIKIPPNPMATLKPTPKPVPKDDFWIEEYRKERSKSPLNPQSGDTIPDQIQKNEQSKLVLDIAETQSGDILPSNPTLGYPVCNSPNKEQAIKKLVGSTTPDRVDSPFSLQPNPNLPKPLSPVKLNKDLSPSLNGNGMLIQEQQNQQKPREMQQQRLHQNQDHVDLERQRLLVQQQSKKDQQQQRQIELEREQQIIEHQQRMKHQQEKIMQEKKLQMDREQEMQKQRTQMQKVQQDSSTRIASPSSAENDSESKKQLNSPYSPSEQNLLTQETLPWMIKRRQTDKEVPEWVSRNDEKTSIPNQNNSNSNATNNHKPKERIIPIQIERTPPTTPTTNSQQFKINQQTNVNESYVPALANRSNQIDSTPTMYRNPNKFVDQGYNDIEYFQPSTPTPTPWSKTSNSSIVHNIPISLTGSESSLRTDELDNPFNVHLSSGTPSNSPTVLQNSGAYRFIIHDCPFDAELRFRKLRLSNPRSYQTQQQQQQNQQSPHYWNQQQHQQHQQQQPSPNQSKSFKVLQKITDTEKDHDKDDRNEVAELHQPHYARPLGPADMNENQLRKLMLSENDRNFLKQVKNDVDQEIYLHTEEDPRYRGAAIPSKAFKMLQHMTDGGQGDSNLSTPRSSKRFQQHLAAFQPDDQPQNEYQMQRSGLKQPIKIQQTISTSPENAGPGQSDL